MNPKPLAACLVCLVLLARAPIGAQDSSLLPEGRVVFLGDSITHHGYYICVLEAHLRSVRPSRPVPELINLGLPSETCSGLSEPDHPFPRPDVHERLDRALAKAKPDLVVACYGMNDGIYHPFSEERFTAFKRGVNRLIEKVRAAGAKLILMTPPGFDPLPMRKQGKLLPAGKDKYAWFAIYEDYDDVLGKYAEWILAQRRRVEAVVDLHSPVKAYLAERRKKDPDFVMSGDGVHLNDEGHRLLAAAMLKAWRIEGDPAGLDAKVLELVVQRQKILHDAWLGHVGHKRPGMKAGLPLDEAEGRATAIEAKIHARLEEIRAQPAFAAVVARLPKSEEPIRLFNGRDLKGWIGDTAYWSVVDGAIMGANSERVPSSTYLFTKENYRQFRLLLEVKQTVSSKHSTMHSAIAALGEQIQDKGGNEHGFRGPLLMFCHDWGIWDAYRRNRVEPAGHRGTLNIEAERRGDWNLIEILVIGNRIRFVANGFPVFDFTDKPELLRESPVGLQLHSNNRPQEYRFRGLVLTRNPEDRLVTLKRDKNE